MTMTTQQFKELLQKDREAAIREVFTHAVEEWMNDGLEEVVRVLTVWATRDPDDPSTPRIDLGNDVALLEYAGQRRVIPDPEEDS